MSAEQKTSYNYIIAVAAFVIAATFGGTRFAFGVFFKPLINELGWSRAVTSGAYSLSYITHGLTGLLIGRIIGRVGPRLIYDGGSAVHGPRVRADGANKPCNGTCTCFTAL